ncbi:MAG: lycopene cyclase family protein [Candidatus Contendobacter sp.]|nr:lycopene cyclase family protein [Candidatus Contendobacter sp.]
MTSTACFDLAILGAGSAGLSLAAALAETVGGEGLKVLLIDARAGPPPDRGFAFWVTPQERQDLPWPLLGQWRSWRFSDRLGRQVIHDGGDARRYVAISALAHRRHCLERIERQPGFALVEGVAVTDLVARDHAVEIRGEGFRAWARHVVDSRNHADHGTPEARLYQQFVGHVLQPREPMADPESADLMTDMSADENGFRFVYSLPLASNRVLVEETRFTPRILPWERLETDCRRVIAARRLQSAAPLQTERGIIPMGLAAAAAPSDPRIRLAGTRGGAVRAATGYAFRRIQDWAARNALRVQREGLAALAGHPPEPGWRGAMDRLFLEVLRRHPQRAPALFMAMATGVSSIHLADFLSDRGGLATAARVIKAMPSRLFIGTLLRSAPGR